MPYRRSMKRLAVIVSVGGLVVGLALFLSPRIATRFVPSVPSLSEAAAPPESEELVIPSWSPDAITPDLPTFTTFTASLSDENIKSARLQFFDPVKEKWRTIKTLSDQGQWEDSIKGDRVFNLRLRLLNSNGTTEIALPARGEPGESNVKAAVPSPAQFRLTAKKKGQAGILVSPPFSIPTTPPSPVTVGGAAGDPPASVEVPATLSIADASDPSWVVLTKFGPDGYNLIIRTRANSIGLSLEQAIISCYLLSGNGPCQTLQPSDPQTLADYDFAARLESADITPLTVSGLSGIQLLLKDSESRSYEIFLDDPANHRFFHFTIVENDRLQQGAFFTDNLSEALRVVQSLQP